MEDKTNKSGILRESVVTDGNVESRMTIYNDSVIHLSDGKITVDSAQE